MSRGKRLRERGNTEVERGKGKGRETERKRTENEVAAAAMVTGGWRKGGRGTSMVAED